MNQELASQFVTQMDEIIAEFNECLSRCRNRDFHYLDVPSRQRLVARARSAIFRIGKGSVYQQMSEEFLSAGYKDAIVPAKFMGALEGLRADLSAGYLSSFEELVHGEIFDDFLDMAWYLHEEGYKDAAAVIAGSSLESHIRQMCSKFGVPIFTEGADKPKRAGRMNEDLAGAGIYSKNEQKQLTAWLGVRNDAAHGNYHKYSEGEVKLMIQGIRHFVSRHPA